MKIFSIFILAAGLFAQAPLPSPQQGGGSGSSGTGTVTTVSVTTANGVSGSVANPTTTPAITLTLGAITPTSVTTTGGVTAGALELPQGTLPSVGSNSVQFTAPTSVGTSYQFVVPGASGTGFLFDTASANVDTLSRISSTGTGNVVLATSPTMVAPALGAATATTINKVTITAPATGSTLTIPDGVTMTGPSSSATVATLGLTNTLTGRQDASGAASTAPIKTGTSLPGTCAVGDLYFKSDATAGQNIYECQSTNTWTQQLNSGGGGGGTVTTVSVTTANGVSGSVANATTTPAITLTLGAITPTTSSSSGTGADQMAAGTTAQQPGSPANAMYRYNSTFNYVEAYQNGVWKPINGSATICSSGVETATTSSTSEASLTNCTIPAGIMRANDSLQIYVLYKFAGATSTRTPTVRYSATQGDTSGGMALTVTAASSNTTVSFGQSVNVFNANSTSAQVGSFALGNSTAAVVTGAINTANASYVNFNCLVANAADSCRVEAYRVVLTSPL